MKILLFALLFLRLCLSDTIPDLNHRELSTLEGSHEHIAHAEPNLIIFPKRPGNKSELVSIRTFLNSLSGTVVESQDTNGLMTWEVFVQDPRKKRQLKQHEGIARVEETVQPSLRKPIYKQRDDTFPLWIVFPTDRTNKNETAQTDEWLRANIANKTLNPVNITNLDGYTTMWSCVTLDDAGVERAKKQPGIKAIEKDRPLKGDRTISLKASHLRTRQIKPHGKEKRDGIEWAKSQRSPAEWELRMHSQYDGQTSGPAHEVQDFVFEKNAGAGSWVYVIDDGVNLKVKDVFGKPAFSNYDEGLTLQTETSREQGQSANTDDSDTSHGTGVASKVGGSYTGTANKVSIISVKAGGTMGGLAEAYEMVLEDIKRNPERAKKSVVVNCVSDGKKWTAENAKASDIGDSLSEPLEGIVARGVPIVLSAGNEALQPGRGNIDTMPKVLAGPNLPLIIVGAVTGEEEVAGFSQGGPLLTTLAGGVQVKVLSKEDGQDYWDDGTSFAAPQVAGTLAQYLNHDSTPWSKTIMDRKRVEDIQAYIQSSDSSWTRGTGVTIFWNGADKAAHDSVGAKVCGRDEVGCDTKLACTNVKFDANNAYLSRWILTDAIDNQYCPRLEGKTSGIGAGTYLDNTPETFEISAIGDVDSRDKVPSVDECKKHLHEIFDGCDIRHDDFNPMDWTAGGEVKADGWTYKIQPIHDRPPALNKPKSWCQIDTCQPGGCTVRMWGAGWESSNFGSALRGALDDFSKKAVEDHLIGDGTGYDTSAWGDNFHYELMDAHEWTVTMPVNLGVFAQYGKTTAIVMRDAIPDLEVDDCVEYP